MKKGFAEWLVARGLTARAARNHAAFVRRVLGAGADPQDNPAFERLNQAYSPSSRSNRRASWRHYQTFIGVEPLPSRRRHVADAIQPTLTEFETWARQLVSEATASGYAYSVGAILQRQKVTPERLHAEFAERPRYRAAWALWTQYQQSMGRTAPQAAAVIPPDQCRALLQLATATGGPARARRLKWADLIPTAAGWRVGDGRKAVWSADAYTLWHTWALPEDDDWYVCTAIPKSNARMTTVDMQRALVVGMTADTSGLPVGTDASVGKMLKPVPPRVWEDTEDKEALRAAMFAPGADPMAVLVAATLGADALLPDGEEE